MTKTNAELQPFLGPMERSPVVAELCRRLADQRHAWRRTGQWGSCASCWRRSRRKKLNRPILILTAHLDEADDAIDQLNFFRPGVDARLYPAFEVLPGESNISHELAAQRLELLVDLADTTPAGAAKSRPMFIVAVVPGGSMQPFARAHDLLQDLVLALRVGQTLDRDKLIRWLSDHGYTRLDAVEDAGDFAVRGEIVDVWPPGEAYPARIDFFGDQIESVHQFDIETLGPIGNIPRPG